MNSILRLEYKIEFFDLTSMAPGAKKIVTITDDGMIVLKEYHPRSRKAYSVRKTSCTPASYEQLCREIEECIANADRQDFYVDDSSEELKIVHRYGRVQTMDRGLGNENIHIGDIMNEFIDNYVAEVHGNE